MRYIIYSQLRNSHQRVVALLLISVNHVFVNNNVLHTHCIMLIFKHMCVASDSRATVVVMLLFAENEYEIDKVWACPELPTITLTVGACVHFWVFLARL